MRVVYVLIIFSLLHLDSFINLHPQQWSTFSEANDGDNRYKNNSLWSQETIFCIFVNTIPNNNAIKYINKHFALQP